MQFGTSQQRFKYYNTSDKHGKLPSPSSYNTTDRTFSLEFSRTHGKSFAVGRDQIQKIHIDKEVDSITKKQASPPPNRYDMPATFGKEGTKFSIRQRMKRYGLKYDGRDDFYFNMQKKLPGPGYYNKPDTLGKSLINSQF